MNWQFDALAQISSHSVAPELHLATTHPFETVRVSLEELSALGYRRIGLHVEKKIDVKLRGEWSAALAVRQQGLPRSRCIPILLQEPLDQTEFSTWIQKYRPDVVLTKHIRARSWLEDLGLMIPADIGFAHLDWRSDFEGCAGLKQHVHVVAAMAVDLVVEQLHHNERGVPSHAKTLLVKGLWVPGTTLRPQHAPVSISLRRG